MNNLVVNFNSAKRVNLSLTQFSPFVVTTLFLCCTNNALGTETDYFTDLPTSTSYSVTTGGLHIPSALIVQDGVFAIQRDNFRNPRFASRAIRSGNTGLSLRMLDYVEVSGRLANYARQGEPNPVNQFDALVLRDLSANVKLQIPQLSEYMPKLAVGATDLGGAATFFNAKYGVATQEIGPIRASLGYGLGSNQQFNGVFGGIEYRPFLKHSFTVLLEDDSRDMHAGVRYTTPEISWLNNARFVATVSRSIGALNERNQPFSHTDASVVLQLPLFDRSVASRLPQTESSRAIQGEPSLPDERKGAIEYARYTGKSSEDLFAELTKPRDGLSSGPNVHVDGQLDKPVIPPARAANLQDLQAALVEQGLEHVRLGTLKKSPTTLLVEYENQRYVRDEVDGMGIVMGIAVTLAPTAFKDIVIVGHKVGLPIGTLSAGRLRYHLFLAGEPARLAQPDIQFQPLSKYDDEDIDWRTEKSSGNKVKLTWEPRNVSTAGTEVGNFDSSAGLNAGVYIPLWKGAEAFISYTDKFYDTGNFGPGRIFGDGLIDGLVNISLQQSFQTYGVHNTVSIAEYIRAVWTLQTESVKFFNQGETAVLLRFSRYVPQPEFLRTFSRSSSTLSYQNFHPELDIYSEVTYHEYLSQDRGFELATRKYFGDVGARLSLRTSDLVKFAGIELELPIAFGEAPKAKGGVQFNGDKVWRQGLFTKVGENDNRIITSGLSLPEYRYQAGDEFFNRYRNNQAHVQANLPRMRQVFYEYALPNLQKSNQMLAN